MAFFEINNVGINGIATAVPKNSVSNFDLKNFDSEELEKLIRTIGIENRRVANSSQCASDLCVSAAEQLIQDLKWDKNEIEVLFFVSQTPDYVLPGTSQHLQERLKLPKSCITFDINQGCAGYVYGLSLISSFISASKIKKGLLLVGDTITKLISPLDKSLVPIFSDAGTATALSYNPYEKQMYFNIGSEGSDYRSIIVNEGGARKPFTSQSLEVLDAGNGNHRAGIHLEMKGLEVFNFSLKKVTPIVETLLENTHTDKETIDYFVFHQANALILESIGKKLGIPTSKNCSSLKNFGNTSGATIPVTITSNLNKNGKITDGKLLLCGFGVGLSLASALVHFNNVLCSDLIEVE